MALITKALKQIIDDKNLVITDSLAEGALRQETRLRKERMQAVLRGYDLSSKRFGPRAREFEIALMCAFEVLYRIEPSSSNKAWIVGVGADGGRWFTHMFWVHKRRPSRSTSCRLASRPMAPSACSRSELRFSRVLPRSGS